MDLTSLKTNRIGFLVMLFLLYLVIDVIFVLMIYYLANIELSLNYSVGVFALVGAGIILTAVLSKKGDVNE